MSNYIAVEWVDGEHDNSYNKSIPEGFYSF